jgi:hypothetical protein
VDAATGNMECRPCEEPSGYEHEKQEQEYEIADYAHFCSTSAMRTSILFARNCDAQIPVALELSPCKRGKSTQPFLRVAQDDFSCVARGKIVSSTLHQFGADIAAVI